MTLISEENVRSKQDNNNTMTTQDPFMTLVDAATALIDDKKKAAEKESLSIVPPGKAKEGPSVTRHHVGHATTPPPPHVSTGKPAALVSPSTPKSSNRTQELHSIFGPREQKQSFARDLMDVLLDPELNDIITFLPDGDAFAILEPKKFQETVMEQRFGIRTFSPFVRKLHRWGFERIMDKKTHAVDVFRHPLFIRGNYHLCDKIKCIGRLVKGPLEEAILTQAGINNKTIGMPTHQEIEIRNFCERMQHMESAAAAAPSPPRRQQQLQPEDNMMVQAYLLEQAARHQADARRQQREAEEALIREAKLRQQAQREAEARQMLQQQRQQQQQQQQQLAESSTVNQIILALQSRSREEEVIAQELQRIKQEELLRQQIAQEAKMAQEANISNALQARLQELLGAVGNNRAPQATEDIPVTTLLRAALENNTGGSLAAQLRQFL